MSHFVESQSSGSSSLRVSNKDNGQDMVKAFLQEISDVELLVAYGSAFDEGSLVRDVSSTGLDIIKALKSKGVINLYPACARIKQAHDLQFNPGYKESCAAPNAAQDQKPYDLDAVHTFFVKSTGRRFARPLPEGMLLSTLGAEGLGTLVCKVALCHVLHVEPSLLILIIMT